MDKSYALIATVPKNSREEIRVGLSEFKGQRLVDVRVYAGDAGSERTPTKKGIAAKVERLPELIAALQAAAIEQGKGGRHG